MTGKDYKIKVFSSHQHLLVEILAEETRKIIGCLCDDAVKIETLSDNVNHLKTTQHKETNIAIMYSDRQTDRHTHMHTQTYCIWYSSTVTRHLLVGVSILRELNTEIVNTFIATPK